MEATWNGPSGHAWVAEQGLLDHIFKPIEDLLVQAVVDESGLRVLDVGCGTGATTLAVAQRLGPNGRAIGIDISAPMLDAARARGGSADFILGDAQTYAFDPARFDTIISRFGVMFFADPIAAFTNLRGAASDGAKLKLVAWRGAEENPFMTTAEHAAAPLLHIPPREPNAPGQFAFADEHRVRHFLEESGWSDLALQPIEVACDLPEKDLLHYLTKLGPVGRALQDADEATRAHVLKIVRAAFDPYVHGDEVRFTAACWLIAATAGR